jgi:hypothetical protein
MAHPSYYQRGRVEVWDFIRDQGLSFHLGNAIKYICRAGHKDDYVQDINKAIHYLENDLQHATRGGVPLKEPPPIQDTSVSSHSEEFDR